MKRRECLSGLAGATAALVLPSWAQQQTRRIAFIHYGVPVAEQTETSRTYWIATFFKELRRLGLVEGGNLAVARFSAAGSAERYAALVAEVIASKPDVIVANSPERLKASTATIPIVAIMGDPIASGLVASLARPGGNLTGVSIDGGPGMIAKRLQLLKQAVPAATRVVTLTGSAAEEARSKGVLATKLLTEVNETSLRRVFAAMADEKVDAVLLGEQGSFIARRALIVELAAKHRLPAIYPYRDYAEAGGLMVYGPDLGELARRMALQVQQILGGAKPGEIPIWQPVKFVTVLNLKTAKALGLAVPPMVLVQADEVIE
jgi:putative tryptophan/tyrosine transport system substrate-binding protein